MADASYHRRLAIMVAAITASVACCGGGLVHVVFTPVNEFRVEVLEADLKKRLPLGSSRDQAKAWFASHNIRTEGIFDNNGEVGLAAHFPNGSRLLEAYIVIELYFGDDGRLREQIIYRYIDCP